MITLDASAGVRAALGSMMYMEAGVELDTSAGRRRPPPAAAGSARGEKRRGGALGDLIQGDGWRALRRR